MAKNRNIFSDVKAAATKDILTVLKSIDPALVKSAVSGEQFKELFFRAWVQAHALFCFCDAVIP